MNFRGSFAQTFTALTLATTLLVSLSACGGTSGDPLLGRAIVIDGARLLERPSDAGVKIGEFATGDQRIVLNFWASWCIPCRDEIPLLAAYELETAPHAVIVGVLYRDEAGPAAAAAAELGATWSTLLDPDGVIAGQVPVNAAPFTLLIDASGVVLDYRVGPFASLEEIRAFVDAP
jgi:cytochrome c biogenesis protein CcmG/thiol:disulfide interchange protein DsbE